MSCKNDIACGYRTIIGVRDFTGACIKPESNLYLNDVPGITLKKAANIADEEIQSGVKLMQEVTRRGILMTFQDFVVKIGASFSFNAVVSTRKIMNFDASSVPAAELSRGLIVRRWRSEMAQLYIEEVYIKAKNSGVGTVIIKDGNKSTSYEVDLLADQVYTVRTDYVAENETVSILMDNASFAVYSGPLQNINYASCCGGAANKGIDIVGFDGVNEQYKYYGLGVNASVRCYEENVICSLMPRMYFLFWYAAAREFFEEQLNTPRLNSVTLFTKEKAEENRDKYAAKYDQAFSDFVPTIKRFLLQTKGDCVACNGSKYVQSTP